MIGKNTVVTARSSVTVDVVGVWRKLQRMGAVRLRGAAWILPETSETTELFQWLVQEIQSVRGEATPTRRSRAPRRPAHMRRRAVAGGVCT